ncbi:Thiosulfate sulfurtransferase GlpE [Poriferisphaera corsica]|uniref:Thiosulfate sulfurtransferase GlpE n=1 Tax=Poriferisphaera corsica TaxID=2528020 RepID=A0A517YW03_9BACT|nr:rhodanese-like domain-containing protein [Poriferisphaera corsica]QDU34421.1 Thiosulfate sulfurtransferase GlpE [Poriferisphaera corsica]
MALKKTLLDLANEVRAEGSVEEIDVEEFGELMNEEDGMLIVDVREPDEFVRGHVKGAVNLPRGVIEMRLEKECFGGNASEADLWRPVVLYCGGGHRSILAGKMLREQGFERVYSLEGGMSAYGEADLEIEI